LRPLRGSGEEPVEAVVRLEEEPLGGPTLKLAVLLSGGGTTLQNVLDRIDAGELPARVQVVVSSKPEAYGLERARSRNIDTHVIARRDFPNSAAFSEAVTNTIEPYQPGLILLAGFMQLYRVPEKYLGKVMNIHPALIPAFCGKGLYGHRVHEAVLEHGAKVSGCTVHFVDNRYDHGPIIVQKTVPVLEGDTAETLAARVFQKECEAYPEAIRLFAEGRLVIDGRRVKVLPAHCG
jgi:formyltetrahydrofolate-dependent phosphoribosylglycinamide formyltransferase